MLPPPPISTLFPYTTLFRSPILPPVQLPRAPPRAGAPGPPPIAVRRLGHGASQIPARHAARDVDRALSAAPQDPRRDRKSTRLNSSHTVISYAVFCLKKKKQ